MDWENAFLLVFLTAPCNFLFSFSRDRLSHFQALEKISKFFIGNSSTCGRTIRLMKQLKSHLFARLSVTIRIHSLFIAIIGLTYQKLWMSVSLAFPSSNTRFPLRVNTWNETLRSIYQTILRLQCIYISQLSVNLKK